MSNFRHCVAGIFTGRMRPDPGPEEFGAVLSVGADPGHTPEGMRHRHVPLAYTKPLDVAALDTCVTWVLTQTEADRTVLVRSEGGRQRPALVVALVVLEMGGSYYDALSCVRKNDPGALTDFRYLQILKGAATGTVLVSAAALDNPPDDPPEP